jgi:3-oxoacyl-[acyl-carrier-protein] synthase II
MNKRRVVISGLGFVTPLGFTQDEVWSALIKQKISLFKEKYYIQNKYEYNEFWAHRVKNFDINNFGIEKTELNYISQWKKSADSKILNYLLAASSLAIDDSNIDYDKEDNDFGCFVTVEHPDFELFCENIMVDVAKKSETLINKDEQRLRELIDDAYTRNEGKGYDLHTFMYLYFLTKVFNLHGYSLFTNNACASGLFAIESAARQIMLGKSSVALVTGGEAGNNGYKYKWFSDRNIYAEDGDTKPFDNNASGFVLGEGASALILEDYEHAKKRGAKIYCEYLGGGFSLEGWKVIYPAVSKNYYQKAMRMALKEAKLSESDIDVINLHGVGLKITDMYEAIALNNVFSVSQKRPYVTAFKPYIGHNLGGSSLIESIILILSMQRDIILPIINCDSPIKQIKDRVIMEYKQYDVKIAMKTACGFAGYNGAVIFKKI